MWRYFEVTMELRDGTITQTYSVKARTFTEARTKATKLLGRLLGKTAHDRIIRWEMHDTTA